MRAAVVAVALALATGILVAGCGTGGKAARGDQTNGQNLFKAKCGGCHTLSAAGTSGTVGPSLDAGFASDRQQGFKDSTIQNVVLDQLREPAPPMPGPDQLFPVCKSGKTDVPKGCVPDQNAALQDVAAYVASVAGQSGAEAPSPAQLGTDGKKIFTTECGSCHTLKAAGTSGTVGPNLDQIKPALPIVVRQVTNGGAIMPAFKGKLSDAQIQAVAKFVSSSAGK